MQLIIPEHNISINIPYSKTGIDIFIQSIFIVKDNFKSPQKHPITSPTKTFPNQKVTDTIHQNILQLYSEGKSLKEIEETINSKYKTNIKRATIYKYLPKNEQYITPEEIRTRISQLYTKNTSFREIQKIIVKEYNKLLSLKTIYDYKDHIPNPNAPKIIRKRTKLPTETKQRIKDLHDSGKSAQEILYIIEEETGKRYGLSTIYRNYHYNNESKKSTKLHDNRKVTTSIKNRIINLSKTNKTPIEILDIINTEFKTNIALTTIYYYIPKTNKKLQHLALTNEVKIQIAQLFKKGINIKKIQTILKKEHKRTFTIKTINKYHDYPIPIETPIQETPSHLPYPNFPEHNAWFINWIRNLFSKEKKFSFNELNASSPPEITREDLLHIISYQLEKHNLLQLSNDFFKYTGEL